jgi:hypothetical protein
MENIENKTENAIVAKGVSKHFVIPYDKAGGFYYLEY